jgi:glycosyltransferase involved in cell wall biosynthesis
MMLADAPERKLLMVPALAGKAPEGGAVNLTLPAWEENNMTAELRGEMAKPAAAVPADLRLSIVIPVFNESRTLAEVIRRVRAVPIAKEIILVDDGSTNGTRELLRSMEGERDLRIVYHAHNRGKGAALKTGFGEATGTIVIVQDADLEYDPADYPRLIQPILRNEADVVYGSRFLLSDARRVRTFWHSLANRVLTTLSNMFTNLHLTDMETCYKVFRREALQSVAPGLKQQRFGIEPELTAKIARGGFRVFEVSISYNGRSYQEGKKIGWRDGLNAIWCILRYWKWD